MLLFGVLLDPEPVAPNGLPYFAQAEPIETEWDDGSISKMWQSQCDCGWRGIRYTQYFSAVIQSQEHMAQHSEGRRRNLAMFGDHDA